jgi:hypothetical protein
MTHLYAVAYLIKQITCSIPNFKHIKMLLKNKSIFDDHKFICDMSGCGFYYSGTRSKIINS